MAVRITGESFQQLWDQWEALLPQGTFRSIFQTPLWHHVWWQELGGDAELCLTAIWEDEALIGIAPLMRTGDTLSLLGDTDLWDYRDFIVAQGEEATFYPALLDHLQGESWRQLELPSLPEHSPTLAHLPSLAEERGYTVEVSKEDVSPGVALPESWDSYLMGLSKKDRHELRRKFRRLDREGSYTSYAVNGTASLNGALDDFFTMMQGSREDKAIFLTSQRERFFRRMAEEVARTNALKLFFLELGGERVAGVLCFDYGNARLLYNSGYDLDYSGLSVGLILKALCLQEAIEEGKEYFDFLRGDERYKYDLGAKDVTLFRLLLQRN